MKKGELEQITAKAREAGFKGEPLIVERWKNKNLALTKNDQADIARGALVIKIGDQVQKSPAVGDAYFKMNFTKIK